MCNALIVDQSFGETCATAKRFHRAQLTKMHFKEQISPIPNHFWTWSYLRKFWRYRFAIEKALGSFSQPTTI